LLNFRKSQADYFRVMVLNALGGLIRLRKFQFARRRFGV